MAPPAGRVEFAFGDDTLEPTPTWHTMDDEFPGLISSYSIDRGRSFELDRVDTGRATITLNDTEGVFDPSNPFNPINVYGDIQPLKQARLALWNPVLEDWYTRFRGFVESYEYDYHPSQRVNQVRIQLVDLFEIVSTIEMFPGYFGHTCPPEHAGNVFFEDTTDGDVHGMQIRVESILAPAGFGTPPTLGGCGIPSVMYDVFSGNVSLHESVYSPGESAMAAIQEAVDAEFPGVGNIYCDRLGIFSVHGRYARFDPVGTSTATGWDFHDWKAGDGAAVAASSTDTAHIRGFSTSRDLAKVINQATASPVTTESGAAYDTHILAQTVEDTLSKGLYGIRPWSTQNLITKEGVTDGLLGAGADWDETKLFGQYYIDNYGEPRERVTSISFRSSDLGMTGTAANWDFLCRCDLNDRVAITIGSPGGGGKTGELYFIEGIHQEVTHMNDTMDEVTLTLDLSPADYFSDSPFAT